VLTRHLPWVSDDRWGTCTGSPALRGLRGRRESESGAAPAPASRHACCASGGLSVPDAGCSSRCESKTEQLSSLRLLGRHRRTALEFPPAQFGRNASRNGTSGAGLVKRAYASVGDGVSCSTPAPCRSAVSSRGYRIVPGPTRFPTARTCDVRSPAP